MVQASGTFSQNHPGFLTVARTNPGVYEFILTNPPPSVFNQAVEVSLSGALPGMITYEVFSLGPPFFVVHTFDAAGSPADRTFSVVVYDLS